MTGTLGPLSDGSRVIILGGGPAGTACALALQRLAASMGRSIRITLIEGKHFSGELHHNQCAGVLTPQLPSLMDSELGIPFPHHLARTKITGYILHSGGEQITLDGDEEPSISVRRVHFDAHMLGEVRKRDVTILTARAVDLEFHANSVIVYTENAPVEGDVVVGAFGLDEGTARMFMRHTRYRPPPALGSVVTKYHPGQEAMEAFGTSIHAFLPRLPRIEFGGMTPKGNHLTINIAGKTVDSLLMKAFLAEPDVRAVLTNLELAGQYDHNDLRFFKGRFPYSRARNYYGDRYVMIGDAAGLVRSFKGKGITSGMLTGTRAARTMLRIGVSRAAFHVDYRVANQDLLSDLPYGRAIRLVAILLARSGILGAVLRAAHHEPQLCAALFEAVSGKPYRHVWTKSLSPRSLIAIIRTLRPRSFLQRGSKLQQ